jgi:hypothetical protein
MIWKLYGALLRSVANHENALLRIALRPFQTEPPMAMNSFAQAGKLSAKSKSPAGIMNISVFLTDRTDPPRMASVLSLLKV